MSQVSPSTSDQSGRYQQLLQGQSLNRLQALARSVLKVPEDTLQRVGADKPTLIQYLTRDAPNAADLAKQLLSAASAHEQWEQQQQGTVHITHSAARRPLVDSHETRRQQLALAMTGAVSNMRGTVHKLENSLVSLNVAGVLAELDIRSASADIERLEQLVLQIEKAILAQS